MTNEQTETLLSYQERLINGLIQVYKKLDELNGNTVGLADSISFKAAEIEKQHQTIIRSLESIYAKELILCDLIAELKPLIMQIRDASDETAGHTLTERNHLYRILKVLEEHTGIDHCDLIRSDEDPEKEKILPEACADGQEQREGAVIWPSWQ